MPDIQQNPYFFTSFWNEAFSDSAVLYSLWQMLSNFYTACLQWILNALHCRGLESVTVTFLDMQIQIQIQIGLQIQIQITMRWAGFSAKDTRSFQTFVFLASLWIDLLDLLFQRPCFADEDMKFSRLTYISRHNSICVAPDHSWWPFATLSVAILSFGITKRISNGSLIIKDDWKIYS